MKCKDSPNHSKAVCTSLFIWFPLYRPIARNCTSKPSSWGFWFTWLLHTTGVRNVLVRRKSCYQEKCSACTAWSPFLESTLCCCCCVGFFPLKIRLHKDFQHKDPNLDFSPPIDKEKGRSLDPQPCPQPLETIASGLSCTWSIHIASKHDLAETKNFHAVAGRKANIQRSVALSWSRPVHFASSSFSFLSFGC